LAGLCLWAGLQAAGWAAPGLELPPGLPLPSAAPTPGLGLPPGLRQGDPGLARLVATVPPDGLVRIRLPGRTADITASPLLTGSRAGFLEYVAVFAVPLETPPGLARVSVDLAPAGAPGTPAPRARLAGSFPVLPRQTRSETIALTPKMDTIKTAADPLRDAQIRRYTALLAATRPDALYFGTAFIPPVDSRRHTAYFADSRDYRYPSGYRELSHHWGVDFGVPTGTPVRAPAAGRVALAENRVSTGWTVILEHLPGVYTIYMHLNRLAVAAGQSVGQGAALGESGATGFATGPHLHWELRIAGVPADPEAWLSPLPRQTPRPPLRADPPAPAP
jgi:murein DD-endopeptidase MepM/ murein hydrolase activator NlpD